MQAPSGRRAFLKTSLGTVGLAVPAVVWSVRTASGGDPDRQPPDGGRSHRSISVERARARQRRLAGDGHYCSADPRLLSDLGVSVGEQLRIAADDREYAVYTVAEVRRERSPGIVRLAEAGRRRLGRRSPFDGTVSTPVPNPDIDDGAAQRASEFVEHLDDSGERGFVVSAPHGGWIERYTDHQAEYVGERIPGATSWRCKGWRDGGGAYERWHVPSTDLHPGAFPHLGSIAGRGFANSVSFHGFADDGVRVGGGAPRALRVTVRDAIAARLPDSVDVRLATDPEYDGDAAENVVNWLTEDGQGGVQIEQDFATREDHWRATADAIVDVFGD